MKWFSPFFFPASLLAFVFVPRCMTGKVNCRQLPCHCHAYNTSGIAVAAWLMYPVVPLFSQQSFRKITFKWQHHLLPKNSTTLTYLCLYLGSLFSWISLCLLINQSLIIIRQGNGEASLRNRPGFCLVAILMTRQTSIAQRECCCGG